MKQRRAAHTFRLTVAERQAAYYLEKAFGQRADEVIGQEIQALADRVKLMEGRDLWG